MKTNLFVSLTKKILFIVDWPITLNPYLPDENNMCIFFRSFRNESAARKGTGWIKGLDRDEVLRFLLAVNIAITKTTGRNLTHPVIKLLIRHLPSEHASRLAGMFEVCSACLRNGDDTIKFATIISSDLIVAIICFYGKLNLKLLIYS